VSEQTDPAAATLGEAELAELAPYGEERAIAAGDVLFSPADETYDFWVIIRGEVEIVRPDPAGDALVAVHGDGRFLGELSLLTGQRPYLTARVSRPGRVLRIPIAQFRRLMSEKAELADVIFRALMARREALRVGEGARAVKVIGSRFDPAALALRAFAGRAHLPHVWIDLEDADDVDVLLASMGVRPADTPVVVTPSALLRRPSPGEFAEQLGLTFHAPPGYTFDLVVVGSGPAGLAAAVYGASEGLETLVIESNALGGQAGSSRRIENYLGFPAGITGSELTGRAVTQARKFHARTATPYRAVSLEPDDELHVVRLEEGHEIAARTVLIATGAQYRRLPVDELSNYEGMSVFYAAGPPEAQLCGASRVGVIGGGNSAGQAAVWLARGGALVTLLHRRADLHETMSDYLVRELERYGVAVRDRSEVAALHGDNGQLESVTLKTGERLTFSFLFLFLGALPCTDWLDDVVARDDKGFILTGAAAGADTLLETSLPGVFAAGDVRSGSTKRCATAVGEGAMAVQFVHGRLAAHSHAQRAATS
jgi:thioredoxin reductase (NADPH)